jgi:hypothetical protein
VSWPTVLENPPATRALAPPAPRRPAAAAAAPPPTRAFLAVGQRTYTLPKLQQYERRNVQKVQWWCALKAER